MGTGSDFDFCLRKRTDVKVEIQTSPQFTCNPDLNQAVILHYDCRQEKINLLLPAPEHVARETGIRGGKGVSWRAVYEDRQ